MPYEFGRPHVPDSALKYKFLTRIMSHYAVPTVPGRGEVKFTMTSDSWQRLRDHIWLCRSCAGIVPCLLRWRPLATFFSPAFKYCTGEKAL